MAEIARLFPSDEVEDVSEAEAAHAEALREATRIAEALIFASSQPVEESDIGKRMPEGVTALEALEELRTFYANRGINLIRINHKWTFRTATDLGWLLSRETSEPKKLSRAAIETLAIIAYHQPVTRAEIEDIRGVAISKGTLDVLMETGWVRLRGRRRAPGRPVTYGTTETFLLHFSLETIGDLPGLDELKAAGMFDGRLPEGFGVPQPRDGAELGEDEDPLEEGATDLFEEQHLPIVEPDSPPANDDQAPEVRAAHFAPEASLEAESEIADDVADEGAETAPEPSQAADDAASDDRDED